MLVNQALGDSPASIHPSLRRILTAVPINSANTDVGTFAGLPAKYRVTRLMVYDASATPVLGTLALYTAAAAGGTNVVAAAVLTALSATTKFTDMTLAVSADYLTSSSLFVRNVVANVAAVTVSVLLEYIDLS